MISRIFNENLFQNGEKRVLKHGIFFFLITGVFLAAILSHSAFENSDWYKTGFYILLYFCICGFCLCLFLIQGFIKNIAKQKALENELKLRAQELEKAKKMEALGILAGSVAHDLNNILSGMATYPEVLMMDKKLDPKLRQGLDIIRDSGQKASAVVRDLLTISRGSSAQMEIMNINSVIDRYIHAHDFEKIRINHKQVILEIIQEPELLNIRGSYIHIEKIIMNLLLNAMEEVSENENAHVIIQTSNSYVDPSISGFKEVRPEIAQDIPAGIKPGICQGEYVVLSVIDNGSGIDKKYMKKIFDPFFTKKQMGKSGTGLGLTVVWNAVQDHGGFMNLESDNNGTRFDLLFPATRKEVMEKAQKGSLDEIKGNLETILVVDDLKDQQRIAMEILENLGYTAYVADNGYAAVDFVKKKSVDLVILDMIMPSSISGLETYKKIKKIRSDQKAIIASGFIESEEVEEAQNLGAGSFINKPYTVLDMGIAIKEELER